MINSSAAAFGAPTSSGDVAAAETRARGRFRCTYCEALLPGVESLLDLGGGALDALDPLEEGAVSDVAEPGEVYPCRLCACGYGRFARYELAGGDNNRSSKAQNRRRSPVAAKIAAARHARLPIGDVCPNPRQPRKFFEAAALAGLAASIERLGLLEDILVRPVGSHYEIVLGERRWRASQLAGLSEIGAKVADLDDDAVAEISIAENIQREDLTPVEEAFSFKAYIDSGERAYDVGDRFGVGAKVAERLRLLNSHHFIAYQEQRIQELEAELAEVAEVARQQRRDEARPPKFDVAVVTADELPAFAARGFDVVVGMGVSNYLVRRPRGDGE